VGGSLCALEGGAVQLLREVCARTLGEDQVIDHFTCLSVYAVLECASYMKNAEISHLISDRFSLMLYLVVRFEGRNDETEN
jgi:hypothetical protein